MLSPQSSVLAVAVRAARLGGREVLQRAQARPEVTWKVQDGVASIVTEADLAAEAAIRAYLATARPQDLVLAEEGEAVDPLAPRLWVVDPLDGSTNFSRNIPFCCVSVAYALSGAVQAAAVFDPFRRELFTARRGRGAHRNGRPIRVSPVPDLREAVIACGAPSSGRADYATARKFLLLATEQVFRVRAYGSTALELCWVAAGRLEGAVNWGSHWWDVAAAALILTEAGGTFGPKTPHWDTKPTYDSMGSNGLIHAPLEHLVAQSATGLQPEERHPQGR